MSYNYSIEIDQIGGIPAVSLIFEFKDEPTRDGRFLAAAQILQDVALGRRSPTNTMSQLNDYSRNYKTWPGKEEFDKKNTTIVAEILKQKWDISLQAVKPPGLGKWDDLEDTKKEQVIEFFENNIRLWKYFQSPLSTGTGGMMKLSGSVRITYRRDSTEQALREIFPPPSAPPPSSDNSQESTEESLPIPETNRQPDSSTEPVPEPAQNLEPEREETLDDLINRAVEETAAAATGDESLCSTPTCDEELEELLANVEEETDNNSVAQEVSNVESKVNTQVIADKSQNTSSPSIFKPDVNVKCIPRSIEEKKSKSTPDRKEKTGGVFCQHIREPVPALVKAEVEVVHKNDYNSWIVLGKDRPSSLASGYGGKGHTQCGSIDIVVGRMSANPKEVDKQGKSVYTEPNFYTDAARIHISQKTDVDRNFGIVKGKSGESVGVSGVGIKADAVRVVARTGGVKIVTNTDLKDSRGGEVRSFKGVELIAGNDDEDMQAMVRGKNLRKCIIAVMKEVERTQGLLFAFMKEQVEYNIALMNHRHITVFPGQESIVSIGGLTAGTKNVCQVIGPLTINAALLKSNIPLIRASYLLPSGRSYILSRYHYLN